MFEMGTGGAASLEPPGSIQSESMHHFSQSHKGLSRRLQGYRFWPEGYDVCAGNRVQLSGTGGREVDQEFEQEKGDGISPTRSHRFPYCPILPGNSRYFLSEALHLDKMWTRIFNFGPIVSHSVPFLLFLAFGRAMPPRLSADTGCGAAMPAQGWSTIHRTHDHIISKFKRLGKRQMSTGCSNVIALAQTLKAGSHSGGGPPAEYGGLPAGR